VTLADLNALDARGFAEALAGVFENSPWIVERVASSRPFGSVDALHAALVDTLMRASDDEKLALLRAHPELAGREASAGALTAHSAGEQASAGLAACAADERTRIDALNRRYRERFGFPFILAVRGLGRRQILDTFARRIECARDVEFRECMTQVAKIARLRLDALITDSPLQTAPR
jgi:OHCU decarboxylase